MCTSCKRKGVGLYAWSRFPSLRLCHECIRNANLELTKLLGEPFIDEVLAAPKPHLIHWLAIDNMFLVEWNRARLVPPWFSNGHDKEPKAASN